MFLELCVDISLGLFGVLWQVSSRSIPVAVRVVSTCFNHGLMVKGVSCSFPGGAVFLILRFYFVIIHYLFPCYLGFCIPYTCFCYYYFCRSGDWGSDDAFQGIIEYSLDFFDFCL